MLIIALLIPIHTIGMYLGTDKVHSLMNDLLTLEERPTMVFRCLQNEMSFLKARKSNSSCVKEMREREREMTL